MPQIVRVKLLRVLHLGYTTNIPPTHKVKKEHKNNKISKRVKPFVVNEDQTHPSIQLSIFCDFGNLLEAIEGKIINKSQKQRI